MDVQSNNQFSSPSSCGLARWSGLALAFILGLGLWTTTADAGQLRIESNPKGAKLFVNGVQRGAAPILLTLQAGRVHLELRTRGYLTWATYLIMPPLTRMTLKVSLEKFSSQAIANTGGARSIVFNNLSPGPSAVGKRGRTRGGLLIANTKPPGAKVYLKGKLIGKTPLLATVPTGTHTLEFRRSGYSTLRREIKITTAKSTKLTITLVAGSSGARRSNTVSSETGSSTQVVITSKPPGAEVFLNGRPLGQTPVLSAGLSPGTYQIVIRRKGYTPYRRSVELRSGQQLRMKVLLVKK